MNVTTKVPNRGCRTIRLPLDEKGYSSFISEQKMAKEQLNDLYQCHPELFPATFDQGYVLCGRTPPSKKLAVQLRRIRLKSDGTVFTISPGFLMPYMTAKTEDVSNAMFFRQYNVPFWAITHVYGRNDMFWYRQEVAFGRFSIVGTTVKFAERLPKDLVADEKHTKRCGEKVYVAMTVADECILGAEMIDSASEAALTEAYGVYAEETYAVNPDYKPETVNTDGWAATQKAWKNCFASIEIILCFLHAFIKIRDRATKALADSFNAAADKVWEAYNASSKAGFSQRIRRLKEWTKDNVPDSAMKTNILKLCAKRDQFAKSYAHESAHRTSNMIDRLMKFLDRACFDSMYFHGTLASGQQRVRAWAVLWNFSPSCPATVKKHGGRESPAERMNGKRYDSNWLVNLVISGSMNGTSGYQQNPL